MTGKVFSERFGYAPEADPNREPPGDFAYGLLQILRESGVRAETVRQVIYGYFRKRENYDNTRSEDIWREVHSLLQDCEWFQVFNILEDLYPKLTSERKLEVAAVFQEKLNQHLINLGLGWEMKNGIIEIRGSDAFQQAIESALSAFRENNLVRAHSEMHEALRDLSRRPKPDLSGAMQHAIAALEAVAREATGDKKATLGEVLKHHPNLLPKPLDSAVGKIWGYSSELARHAKEGVGLKFEETQMTVTLAAAVACYLAQKLKSGG